MSGDEILNIRIESLLKGRVKEAAKRRGQSLTTFVTKALEQAARKVEKMDVASLTGRVFQGVPAFFRAACSEATRGGENGYYRAGWLLLRNLPTLVEGSQNDVQAKLDELRVSLNDRGDDYSVMEWLKRELPLCVKLVPARRADQFVEGIYDSWKSMGRSFRKGGRDAR